MTAQKISVMYPKPRYTVEDCLVLLGESRDRFYAKVRSGRYQMLKDGRRSYMTHQALEDAAKGDSK